MEFWLREEGYVNPSSYKLYVHLMFSTLLFHHHLIHCAVSAQLFEFQALLALLILALLATQITRLFRPGSNNTYLHFQHLETCHG